MGLRQCRLCWRLTFSRHGVCRACAHPRAPAESVLSAASLLAAAVMPPVAVAMLMHWQRAMPNVSASEELILPLALAIGTAVELLVALALLQRRRAGLPHLPAGLAARDAAGDHR